MPEWVLRRKLNSMLNKLRLGYKSGYCYRLMRAGDDRECTTRSASVSIMSTSTNFHGAHNHKIMYMVELNAFCACQHAFKSVTFVWVYVAGTYIWLWVQLVMYTEGWPSMDTKESIEKSGTTLTLGSPHQRLTPHENDVVTKVLAATNALGETCQKPGRVIHWDEEKLSSAERSTAA